METSFFFTSLFLVEYLQNGVFKAIILVFTLAMVGITLIIATWRKNSEMSMKIVGVILTWGSIIVTFYFATELCISVGA